MQAVLAEEKKAANTKCDTENVDPEKDPLSIYLAEIKAVPTLSPTEESGLLKRVREQQDQRAKIRLVESYSGSGCAG